MGPLTNKFDRATQPFLKIDMRHGAYRHEKKYYQHYMDLSLNSTADIRLFKNRHGNCNNYDKGHYHLLKSTCNIGDPRQGPHSMIHGLGQQSVNNPYIV